MSTNLPLPTFAAPRMALFPIVALAIVCGGFTTRAAAQAATVTTLAVTAGGHPATTVSQGTVVTLTATVKAEGTTLTRGLVNFCDAKASYCSDVHIVGSARLTKVGTATFRFRPGAGVHLYDAVFTGTSPAAASVSGPAALTVTPGGPAKSATHLVVAGTAGTYSLTARVAGSGSALPTGTVSFLDTSNGNAVLGSARLGANALAPNFLNASNPSVGYGAYAIVVGDFNGDGIPDLAVASESIHGPGMLTILLGNGDGTFTATAKTVPTGVQASWLAVGDFNGDGVLDLAIVVDGAQTSSGQLENGSVLVLLGNSDGTFSESAHITTGVAPGAIIAGDFNGDGILDLAVSISCSGAGCTSSTVAILLGNGDGTFAATGENSVTVFGLISMAAADLNGDGNLDLVLTSLDASSCDNLPCPGTVTVLLGNGKGTFTALAGPAVGNIPSGIVAGDFNGDGIPDLAVSNRGDNTVTVLVGKGDGTFTVVAASQATGPDPRSLAVGDFNGDSIPDLAIVNSSGDSATILTGKGDGTFAFAIDVAAGVVPGLLGAADFTGDGVTDLAFPDGYGNVTVLLAEPEVVRTPQAGITLPAATGTHQVVASYSGDSHYNASISLPVALTAAPGTPTVSLVSSAKQSAYGLPVTLTAALSAGGGTPTGVVTFMDGSKPLNKTTLNSSGVANFTTQGLAAGLHSLTATYSGDGNYNPAASAAVSLTVTKATLPISLTPSATTIPYDTAVTFTAALIGDPIDPTGAVTFFNGATALGTSAISSTGVAVWSSSALASGNYSIKAVYSGDTDYNAVTSAAVAIGVRRTPSVSLAQSASTAAYGQRVSFTATVLGAGAAPTGTLDFLDGRTALGSASLNSSGVATFSTSALAVGSHSITAAYLGDANYGAMNSAAVTVTVGTFAEIVSPVAGSTLPGPAVTFRWSTAQGATAYQLWLGSIGVDSNNLYSSGSTTATTKTVTLPTNGETIYARLFTENNGTWTSLNSTYTAAAQAVLTAPAASGKVTGPTMKFTWTAANPAPTAYQLWVGTTGVGSNNVYSSGAIAATSATVGHLPTSGTVYVRLYTEFGSTWVHTDLTFQAQ